MTNGAIIHPGANGTTAAARFDFGASNAVFYQGMARPEYLDGSSTYHPDLANAVEFYARIPTGSMLLSSTTGTIGFWTYHWLHGDPWVGTNWTGGNLTDSQMHGYSNLRLDPASAGQWQHVVLSTSAFAQSRGNYHFYAARAVVQDQTFFGSLRQFEIVTLQALTMAPTTADLDELQLVTLPPTASACPPWATQTVSASGGDVAVPVTLVNPTSQARSYRVFLSSEIGLDRQTLEGAMHDTDNVVAVDDLQGGVGADGGLGAAELFAADSAGRATGTGVVASGQALSVPAGGSFHGVVVHHVKPAMLGPSQSVMTGGRTYIVGDAQHAHDEPHRLGSKRPARRRYVRRLHRVQRRQQPRGASRLPGVRGAAQRLGKHQRPDRPGRRLLRVVSYPHALSRRGRVRTRRAHARGMAEGAGLKARSRRPLQRGDLVVDSPGLRRLVALGIEHARLLEPVGAHGQVLRLTGGRRLAAPGGRLGLPHGARVPRSDVRVAREKRHPDDRERERRRGEQPEAQRTAPPELRDRARRSRRSRIQRVGTRVDGIEVEARGAQLGTALLRRHRQDALHLVVGLPFFEGREGLFRGSLGHHATSSSSSRPRSSAAIRDA